MIGRRMEGALAAVVVLLAVALAPVEIAPARTSPSYKKALSPGTKYTEKSRTIGGPTLLVIRSDILVATIGSNMTIRFRPTLVPALT